MTDLSTTSGLLLKAFVLKLAASDSTIEVVRRYGEAQRRVDAERGTVLDRRKARAQFAARLSGLQHRYKRLDKERAKLLIETYVEGYDCEQYADSGLSA